MHAVTSGLGFSPLHAPGAGPPTCRSALPCTLARAPPPRPQFTRARRAQLVAAPPPPCPAPPPLPAPLPALPAPPPPLWQARARRWPRPREPWRRVQEEDLSDRGPPTGCQLWSLQLDEPQRPQRRRTRSRPAGRTDALTAQLALPPGSSLCGSGEPAGQGWARRSRGSSLRGWGRPLRPPERAIPRGLTAPLLLRSSPGPFCRREPAWRRCRS